MNRSVSVALREEEQFPLQACSISIPIPFCSAPPNCRRAAAAAGRSKITGKTKKYRNSACFHHIYDRKSRQCTAEFHPGQGIFTQCLPNFCSTKSFSLSVFWVTLIPKNVKFFWVKRERGSCSAALCSRILPAYLLLPPPPALPPRTSTSFLPPPPAAFSSAHQRSETSSFFTLASLPSFLLPLPSASQG